MCQLLGMNANTPTDVMFSFTGLATRADEHKDGFGIAFFEDKGLRHFIDRDGARSSPVAELVKHYPIRSDNVIAHIRKATQGSVALQNCHPFVRELWGRYWVFAHNGDLKDYAPRLHGAFRPVGDTDSERAFCWLMQELAKAHASVPRHRGAEPRCASCCRSRRHGSFNVLLSNGQALWAHASTRLHSVERRTPSPRHAGRRGSERRLRRADHAAGPRGRGRHRAAHAGRGLAALCAGRAVPCVMFVGGQPTEPAASHMPLVSQHPGSVVSQRSVIGERVVDRSRALGWWP
jgi:predicted glutamine amidotransferase